MPVLTEPRFERLFKLLLGSGKLSGDEYQTECPCCCGSKFYANLHTGQWKCFHENKSRESGNNHTLILLLNEGVPNLIWRSCGAVLVFKLLDQAREIGA